MASSDTSQNRSPMIVPTPRHARLGSETNPLGSIVLTENSGADPWALRVVRSGLTRLGLPEPVAEPPSGPHTLLSLTTAAAPLRNIVTRCRDEFGEECAVERLTDEGYVLEVRRDGQANLVTIAATGGAGLAYGADTFLQLIAVSDDAPRLFPALIFDFPAVAIRMYGGSGNLDEAAAMRFNMRGCGGTPEQIREMRMRHIEPWTTVHPSHAYAGDPGLRYSDENAVERAIAPIVEAAAHGVKWVGMNFDDIDLRLAHPEDVDRFGTIGKAHAAFINHALRRVREKNPEARLTVIPIIYANNWLPGTWVYAADEAEVYDYLETLGREADPSVVFIWTGESVESVNMTDDDIGQWVNLVKRKPVVFENTPTGDLTDFGPLRFRTRNIGELLAGWIYISRGPQAQVAELSTAEYLWNPTAYDPDTALARAVRRIVGREAAPPMERLIRAFSARPDKANDPRYKHPLWREGRLLEIVEPDDPAVADFYVERIGAISATVPKLDALIWDNPFYQAVRKTALAGVDLARAYLETYTMVRFAERGQLSEALEAGDRAEALLEEWNRASSGSTDLNAPTERRDAMTYIEQVGVARRLRALRRGTSGPVLRMFPEKDDVRLGRECATLSRNADPIRMSAHAAPDSSKWLVVTACGEPNAPVRLQVNGDTVPLPENVWTPRRWRSVAVPLPPKSERCEVSFSSPEACDWALFGAALLQDPSPTLLLHATRSSAAAGEVSRLTEPTRFVLPAETEHVVGRVAARRDIEIKRGVSGQFLDLQPGVVIGQTFHLPSDAEQPVPPKDPIRLIARESCDGDYLAGVGVMFQQQGEGALSLDLWRWKGSVEETTARPDNRIAAARGRAGTPFGPSHHWVEFPLGVELDEAATYYFALSAPEGWRGWRLRQSYGWYGRRSDPKRSAYRDGTILAGADIPFATTVWDVYDAEWRRRTDAP